MTIISSNPIFGTLTKVVSPRIDITWDSETNDGPVEFHLEQMSTKKTGDEIKVLERFFLRVLFGTIADLVSRDYAIVDAQSQIELREPGWKLILGIKAATRAAYLANVEAPDPEADPIAPRISIVWNPYNDDGTVTFQMFDRGEPLGILAESIKDLVDQNYTIANPVTGAAEDFPGWKLKAMIKAATDDAYLRSVAPPVASVPEAGA